MTKRVIELVRVSTEGQAGADRASIPSQHTINQRTAQAFGLEIVDCIELVDVSGAAVLRAPGMQQLLKRIEDPQIHGVVVREFSRVMRPDNFADYALLQQFIDTRTVLYLPDGPIDLASKSGRLVGTIRAVLAGLERSEILERVWMAKEEKRRAGKHPQGQVVLPFGVGYDAKQGRWFYKEEVEKVREAARLFLSGQTSYKEVGKRVGIDPFNLRVILRNPIYMGWRIYATRRDPSSAAIRTRPDGRQGDRPKIARAPEDVIRVKVLESIISEEDFRRLQDIMDLKKQDHWRARPDYEKRFLFSGFLRCGVCGDRLYTAGRQNHGWYVCKTRKTPTESGPCSNPYMRRERLEADLNRLIAERLTNGRFLQQLAAAYAGRATSDGQPDHARLETAVLQLQEKRQRVLDAYFENLIDREERDRRLQSLKIDAALYGKLAMRAAASVPSLSARELAEVFSVFREWKFLGRADKRQILRAAMPEVHVADYRVTGIALIPGLSSSSGEINRTGTDSSLRRA